MIGLDFAVDKIDLPGSSVSNISATVSQGALSLAGFDTDLATALASVLRAGQAVLYMPDSGTMAAVSSA